MRRIITLLTAPHSVQSDVLLIPCMLDIISHWIKRNAADVLAYLLFNDSIVKMEIVIELFDDKVKDRGQDATGGIFS